MKKGKSIKFIKYGGIFFIISLINLTFAVNISNPSIYTMISGIFSIFFLGIFGFFGVMPIMVNFMYKSDGGGEISKMIESGILRVFLFDEIKDRNEKF
jgi:hypothetical protein